jgi:diacylglycerol kinase family enzyme
VVALLVLDLRLVEPPPELGTLVLVHAECDVVSGAAGLVQRKRAEPCVRHHRVALRANDSRAEEALVERGGALDVRCLDSDVVEACHPPHMFHPTLIVNPSASRVDERTIATVERVLRPAETLRTESRGHATELARAVTSGPIVVLGGDGVANEVLNGVSSDVAVGFLPAGGTSVLARALGLPRDPVAAAHVLVGERTRRIALGRVNGRRFAFSAGIGLDAAAVRHVEELGRSHDGRRAGDVRFALALLRAVPAFREPALEVAGLGRAAFALVANTDPYSYAGPFALHVAPHARFELGLDLVAPKRVAAARVPRYLRYVLRGSGQDRDPGVVHAHDRDLIEIACDRALPVQADGEDLGDAVTVVLEAERDAVSVLC